MLESYFSQLSTRLLDAGIAAGHVRRTSEELRDHFDDLMCAAEADGASEQQAAAFAVEQLGPVDQIVSDMAARSELKSWAYRFPRAAVVCYPMACVAVLPAFPILAGIAHASSIVRWGASLFAAAIFTALMLLLMQLSIFLG